MKNGDAMPDLRYPSDVIYQHGVESFSEYSRNLSPGGLFIRLHTSMCKVPMVVCSLVLFPFGFFHENFVISICCIDIPFWPDICYIPGSGRNCSGRERDVMEKKRVLVVDDNEFFIQQEISCLGRDGFDFFTARCGRDALEMARALMPDLILLDHIMPDLTGPEVCRSLKSDPLTRSIPIIIVSSGSLESSRIVANTALCDGLIQKPIRRDLLTAIVEELLGSGQRHTERAELSLPCTVSMGNVNVNANVLSLSSDGAFVDLDTLPVPGEMFEIRFNLPGQERAVYVRWAAVVWTGRFGENGPEGAGMRFLIIDSVEKAHIDDYVRMVLKKDPVKGLPRLKNSFPL